ncbi:hypothetical protein IC582_002088 [Cucumis melo]
MTIVENSQGEFVPTRVSNSWPMYIYYRKLNKVTLKDHFHLPFLDQMIEQLGEKSYFCFLDGFFGFYQIQIAYEDQYKTTFTCEFGTFAFRRMLFGLFQRCTLSIFIDFIGKCRIFRDDFTVYGNDFDSCLNSLEKILKRCVDTNLVLDFEKCHFMTSHGTVLGHLVSSKGIGVDKTKIYVLQNLSYPTCLKDVRSFLGSIGFYRRFIKDLSKIALVLTSLLQKNVPFIIDDKCIHAFDTLKDKLTSSLILQTPN